MSTIDELYAGLKTIVADAHVTRRTPNELIQITETEKGATKINKFNFKSKNSCVEINTAFLDSFGKIFPHNKTSLYHNQYNFSFLLKCDGIIIYQKGNQLILNLVELKDQLKFTNFACALSQIEASHFKVKLVMDILESINIQRVKPYCMIISNLPIQQDLQSQNLYLSKRLNQVKSNSLESKLIRYYYTIVKDQEITLIVPVTNCCEFLVKPKYKFNKMPIKLILGNDKLVTV
jgi:hypothetical protein